MDSPQNVEPNNEIPVQPNVASTEEQVKAPQVEQERMPQFVPVNQDQTEVLKAQQQQPITVKLYERKLNDATQLKNNGNAKFKNKNYVEAIKQYTEALKVLDPSHFYGATQAECQKMAELSANLLCNIGFCYFNSYDMSRADVFFSEAIMVNPKYTKALHKRALARFELQKYQEAFEDIKLAFSFDKSNAEIHSAYSKILEKYNEQKKKSKEQMKELSSKIFNASQKSTNSPKKQNKNQVKTHEQVKQPQKQKPKSSIWSWPSMLTAASAAAFIGVGLYKAFKN